MASGPVQGGKRGGAAAGALIETHHMTAHYLIPPNFGYVEEDLYRSGTPNVLSFPFLERLRLRTLLYLAPDDPPPAFLAFLEDQDIQLVHVGKEGASYQTQNPWNPISEDMVVKALQVLLSRDCYPLHIMCNLGRHRTGLPSLVLLG